MVILTGFFSLIMALPALMPIVTYAESGMDDGMRKKRYRYRKRTHRIQVGVDAIPWSSESKRNMKFGIDFLYGYNAGHFEIGPNIKIENAGDGRINLGFRGGIWGEFNMIKNTRKEKFVPALGLKINYQREDNKNYLLWGPNLALKYFPASRTGLVFNISYDIRDEFSSLFKLEDMQFNLSLAYVHYFNF